MSNCPSNCLSPIYTSCVFWDSDNIENDCFTICRGKSLTEIITDITTYVCNNTDNCNVKVTSDDECCGFLATKLVSEDNSVTFETLTDEETGCQTLSLTTTLPNPDWSSVEFESDFQDYSGVSRLCQFREFLDGKVEVRGRIKGTNFPGSVVITLSLPAPNLVERFAMTINNNGTLYPAELTIQQTGELDINVDTTGWSGAIGSFDINFYYYIT